MPNEKDKKRHKKKPHKDVRYDEELIVTRHGYKRSRERLGIPKDAVKKNAEKALIYGVERHDASGPLRRYLDALFYEYCTANNLRVFNRHIYIFCDEVLVTVMNVPYKYFDACDVAQRRKRKAMEENNDKHKSNSHTKR